MNKTLRNAICNRSRFKNNLNKNPTDDNKIKYKKKLYEKFVCKSKKKGYKTAYKELYKIKTFWEVIKPCNNKNGLSNNNITIFNKNLFQFKT